MTQYTAFFTGTATVAGALVGLVFVALPVAPERLRGSGAPVEHQAIAATAFTALRYGAVIMGGIGLTSSCGLAVRLWHARGAEGLRR